MASIALEDGPADEVGGPGNHLCTSRARRGRQVRRTTSSCTPIIANRWRRFQAAHLASQAEIRTGASLGHRPPTRNGPKKAAFRRPFSVVADPVSNAYAIAVAVAADATYTPQSPDHRSRATSSPKSTAPECPPTANEASVSSASRLK